MFALDLTPGDKKAPTRFGILTSWIDGKGQSVYWDDLTYTVEQ